MGTHVFIAKGSELFQGGFDSFLAVNKENGWHNYDSELIPGIFVKQIHRNVYIAVFIL